jgi:hypothetical protein
MGTEFGWWARDPEQGKFQVRAWVHGGNVTWERKQGHFTSWLGHAPTGGDWDRLMAEAEKRVPRRLISPKQFEAIKGLRPRD